jgi:translation initiation factor 1
VPRGPETRLVYSTGDAVEKVGEKTARVVAPAAPGRAGSGIRLRLERRASDRVVTVVTGLPGRPADLAALARTLKSACGAGGTVKDGAVELQGDQREKVEAALLARGLKWKRAGG